MDVLKGFGAVGVVFIHVMTLGPTTTNSIGSTPLIELFYSGLMMFFILSGYFYKPGVKPLDNIKKRAKQILIPFVVFCILLTVIMALYGDILGYHSEVSEVIDVIVKTLTSYAFMMPAEEYDAYSLISVGWYFLMAAFVGMVVFYIIADKALKNNRNFVITIICLLVITAIINFVTEGMMLPFRIQVAPLVAAFMLVGAFFKTKNVAEFVENEWKTRKYWIVLAIALAVGLSFAYFFPTGMKFYKDIFGDYLGWSVFTFFVLNVACGYVLWCLAGFISKVKPMTKIFGTIGRYTLYILVFHAFYIKLLSAPFYGLTKDCTFPSMPIWASAIFGIAAIILSILTAYAIQVIKKRMKNKHQAVSQSC